ncbi:MAG: DUF1643 domain-containing protein [Phycisphaerales bacterium JB050]
MPPALTVPGFPEARSRASFSRCRRYRYSLVREWDAAKERICFCMLNPSTADERQNDPTVRRAIGYALDRGFGSIEVVNAFALRSTDPAALKRAIDDGLDPIGARNDEAIRRAAARSKTVVAAWGAHARLLDRDRAVRSLLGDHPGCVALGFTADGLPRHPLYLRADAPFIALPRI